MTRARATGRPHTEQRLTPDAIRPLSEREFRLFRRLIQDEAGIHLADTKQALVAGRLNRRLRELGLRTFTAYYRLAVEDPAELTHLIDRICTNETHFFREPRQFDHLREKVLPAWIAQANAGQRPRRVRVWSAACSTGEEPYSLAMVLLDALGPHSGWEIDIVASDLSTRVLATAREATYPIEKSSEIPQPYLRRYMLRGTSSQEGRMRVGPAARSLVRFARINLNAPPYGVGGPFDLIFCRNTLIYFEAQTKTRVITQLIALLAPDGQLFLGHAESASGLTDRVRSVGPTVYAPLPAAPAGREGKRRRM